MSNVNFNNNKFNGKIGEKRAYDYYNKSKHLRFDTANEMIDVLSNGQSSKLQLNSLIANIVWADKLVIK